VGERTEMSGAAGPRDGDTAPHHPEAPPLRSAEALGPAVEIVSAGNEVLLGDVLDTNTNWLCRRITGLGGHVRRAMLLRDDVDAIADELRAAVARRPALVFTVGGLGPTADDLTLAAVAEAFGRPLELHPTAEQQVRERYAEFAARGFVPFAGMNKSRLKMARLPRGAAPLVNPVGGAPGVLLEIDGVAIVSLPGVPGELKAIVDGSLAPLLHRVFGSAHYEERALLVDTQDESAIAHVLAAVEQRHPHVYVKSRAQRIGSASVNRITVSARGRSQAAVDALLSPVVAELTEGIAAAGFAAHPGRPDEEGR